MADNNEGIDRVSMSEESLRWMKRAADLNHPAAMNHFGLVHLHGSENVGDGEWGKTTPARTTTGGGGGGSSGAGMTNHNNTMTNNHNTTTMTNHLTNGEMAAQAVGVMGRDQGTAVKWFMKAALAGSADAQNNLGKIWLNEAAKEGEATGRSGGTNRSNGGGGGGGGGGGNGDGSGGGAGAAYAEAVSEAAVRKKMLSLQEQNRGFVFVLQSP
jgi:hypothetical protein